MIRDEEYMVEAEIDLRQYVEVLIRHWKWIVGLTLLVAMVALVVSFFVPATYKATALVAVTEPRYMMRFDPRFETVTRIQQVYRAYPELAASDELLQDLLARLDSSSEDTETLQDLREMVEAESGADPSMVRLGVRSQDPEEAARVANAWAELFVSQANEIYGAHSEDQVSFFEDQLGRTQVELDSAEQALIAFQARNQGSVLGARLMSARQDLQDYLVEQRGIERAVRNARALQTSIADQPADRLVSLGDDLAALLLQVQAFNVEISRPPRPVQPVSEGGEREVGVEVSVSEAREMPSISLQISDAALLSTERTVGELVLFLDGLIATLETRAEDIGAQVGVLEPQILALQKQLEEIQAEGERLTRAREVAQETYLTLAHKVEEVRIAVEDTGGEVRLASRASVPERPVSPRKALNTVVGGILGLILGIFGVFAVEWWQGNKDSEDKRGQQGLDL